MTSHRSRVPTARLAIALAVVSAWLPAGTAVAQDYVTTTAVHLRRSPSLSGEKLRLLPPGDSLHARNVQPRPGWLPVRTLDGRAGWVSEFFVRNLAALAASAATTIIADADGDAFDRVDSTWAKAPIVRSTMRVRGGTQACGPLGSATPDDGTNLNKNRNDIPATSHLVTVDAIRALPDTELWRFKNRKRWTASDSSLVLPYEGIALTVEGFFEIVKPQAGNGESPNCGATDESDTDWHIALVADPSETEEQSVIIEPTPRTKRNNVGWNPALARRLAVRSRPSAPRDEANATRVRVTGFLMLDPVHPDHIRGACRTNCGPPKRFFRATLWEIHPVTRIEVFRNGDWVNLNSLVP